MIYMLLLPWMGSLSCNSLVLAQTQLDNDVEVHDFKGRYVCLVPDKEMEDPRSALAAEGGVLRNEDFDPVSHKGLTCTDMRSGRWSSICIDGVCDRMAQPWDRALAAGIGEFLVTEEAASVVDFGCGPGKALSVYRALDIDAWGIEGDKAMSSETNRVEYMDLSEHVDLSPRGCCDWVLTFDVAEHIPLTREHIFLDNLHRSNRHGIVMSWAIRGQHGFGHVNNRNAKEILDMFTSLGYDHDDVAQARLRSTASENFGRRETLYVFRKKQHHKFSLEELRDIVRRSHIEACFPPVQETGFFLVWHVDWGMVHSDHFESLQDATAAFREKEGGEYATLLFDENFKRLRYYGEESTEVLSDFAGWWERRRSMRRTREWCCTTGHEECFQDGYSFTYRHCCSSDHR